MKIPREWSKIAMEDFSLNFMAKKEANIQQKSAEKAKKMKLSQLIITKRSFLPLFIWN